MSTHAQISRAQLLYAQSRYDMAEQEVRQALVEEPHDPYAHGLLGLCLMRQDRLPEAQAETEQAIVLAPDNPYPHYCRSIVLTHRNKFREAENAAREAIRIEPADADYHAQLSVALFQQERWQEALQSCENGLQYDAEHAGCSNMRSMALTRLGRQQESIQSVDQSLARDPDDEMAHANKGWALLHEGRHQAALEHFREALRLDPNFDYARHGIVEALKARNPIYRLLLGYFLWMARLENRARWAVIIGGYVGYRVLRGVARQNPDLQPWIMPILIVYIAFALLTWFAVPLFNLMLRLNKFGRHALSRDQRTASNWFGVCLLTTVVGIVVGLLTGRQVGFLAALYGGGLAMPLVTLFSCDHGWPRRSMTLWTIGMALVGAVGIVGELAGLRFGSPLLGLFLIGFIATPWVANYLASVTPQR